MNEKHTEIYLAVLLFFYALGIILAWNFNISFLYLTAIFAVFFIATIILFLKNYSKIYIVFLFVIFLAGSLRLTDAITLSEDNISNYSGEEVKIFGVLKDTPKITEKKDTKRVRYTLDIREIEMLNERKKASGTVYLYAPYNDENAKIGDRIEAFANIRKTPSAGNPGEYDRRTHLLAEGITAEAFGGKSGVKITNGDEYFVLRKAAEIREHYKDSMEKVMPGEDAAAIFAMLFGGYNGLQEELVEVFTITGIVHILSVSGSHVSMLAAAVAWLGKILRIKKKFLVVLVFIIIGFYTLLAGMAPPALRAAAMGCVAFFGIALERDVDAKRLLTLVAFSFLLYNPLLLFHISFELSFAATTGIIYLLPKLTKFFRSLGLSYIIASNFAFTVSAQLLTIPIIAYYFHRLSLSSLFANLLIVPIVEFVIIIGLFAGIVAFVFPFFGGVIFLFNSLILGIVYEATRLLSKMPFASVYLPVMSVFLSIVYYLSFLLIMFEDWQREKLSLIFEPYKKTLGLFCIIFSVVSLIFVFLRPKEVMFAFIDVGQGDAMVVKTENGRAFMIDTGGSRDETFDVGAKIDVPFLFYHGITELDYIFLTHAHEDHAAGAGGVLKYIPVKEIITANEGVEVYRKSLKVNQKIMEKTVFKTAEEGDVFDIDGVKVKVLYAPKTAAGENEMSNLYRVSFKDASALITGDLLKENEIKLVENKTQLASTILKVGHHGSKTSSSMEFLKSVNPKFAVISVGAYNSFGHPHEETLKNLREIKTKIYRTDKDGAVFFYTDGKKIRVNNYLKK